MIWTFIAQSVNSAALDNRVRITVSLDRVIG
jgi:hypothetical protein